MEQDISAKFSSTLLQSACKAHNLDYIDNFNRFWDCFSIFSTDGIHTNRSGSWRQSVSRYIVLSMWPTVYISNIHCGQPPSLVAQGNVTPDSSHCWTYLLSVLSLGSFLIQLITSDRIFCTCCTLEGFHHCGVYTGNLQLSVKMTPINAQSIAKKSMKSFVLSASLQKVGASCSIQSCSCRLLFSMPQLTGDGGELAIAFRSRFWTAHT